MQHMQKPRKREEKRRPPTDKKNEKKKISNRRNFSKVKLLRDKRVLSASFAGRLNTIIIVEDEGLDHTCKQKYLNSMRQTTQNNWRQ